MDTELIKRYSFDWNQCVTNSRQKKLQGKQ